MADDDVFGGSSSDEEGGASAFASASDAETAAQRRVLQDAGYRDGAGGPEGHALGLQEGFDVGFAKGLADGRALGQALGALSGIHSLEERVPRGLPGPPLPAEAKRRLEEGVERLTALAPTMPAADDPAVASERAEAARVVAAMGMDVERVVGPGAATVAVDDGGAGGGDSAGARAAAAEGE